LESGFSCRRIRHPPCYPQSNSNLVRPSGRTGMRGTRGGPVSIRIVLADDHRVLREAVRLLLTRSGVEVMGEADNAVDLVNMARDLRPQVVVTDLSMPMMNGIDAAVEIRRELGIPVVLLTARSDSAYVRWAMSNGVAGYVVKSRATISLVEAIREVCQGNVYVGPGISDPEIPEMLKRRESEQPFAAREYAQSVARGH